MLASISRILLLFTKMSTGILCFLLDMTWSVHSETFLVTFSKVDRTSTNICLIFLFSVELYGSIPCFAYEKMISCYHAFRFGEIAPRITGALYHYGNQGHLKDTWLWDVWLCLLSRSPLLIVPSA